MKAMKKIWSYLKRYPVSILIVGVVIFLSFFNPSPDRLPRFPGWDKIAHFLMYAGLSGMLWLEFLRNHRKDEVTPKHGFIGAMILPIIFSGVIEILQSTLTKYRSGDGWDFVANMSGILVATLVAWCLIRPWMLKKRP